MILFHVDFQTVMILELLGTVLANIARGKMLIGSLYVLPHLIHISAPLSTQETNKTTAISSLLAVGLQMVVRI